MMSNVRAFSRGLLLALLLTGCVLREACALGPHEILLLVNADSADSVRVAESFARLRQVPEQNLVRLSGLPPKATGADLGIAPEAFTRLIWEPAVRTTQERGIDDHILAWVYSVDFPVRVSTRPIMSLQGITFLRNQPRPDFDEVDKGRYKSFLFSGPLGAVEARDFPQTFDVFKEWLGQDMPLPSMMLGYIGERGNTLREVLRCLEQGARADGTAPSGTVYFVEGDDIRANVREWQFPAARRELAKYGVRAIITNRFPEGAGDVMGIVMGEERVEPEKALRYLPGAGCEHLTSMAAMFDAQGQTKLSAWISAGVTATAGTVVEPFSLWTKFPHSRYFVYYAAGCTVMESYFQSIRSPLQILLVGDPLCAPWAERTQVQLAGWKDLPGEPLKLAATVQSPSGARYGNFLYLLDGRVVAHGREWVLERKALSPGKHRLRVIASRSGLVRTQAFLDKEFEVRPEK